MASRGGGEDDSRGGDIRGNQATTIDGRRGGVRTGGGIERRRGSEPRAGERCGIERKRGRQRETRGSGPEQGCGREHVERTDLGKQAEEGRGGGTRGEEGTRAGERTRALPPTPTRSNPRERPVQTDTYFPTHLYGLR